MTSLASELTHSADALDNDVRLVWEAGLAIDRDHPYFFDHPLDHVPAILLVEGALRLVGSASDNGGRPPTFGLLHLDFHSFCELGQSAVVRAWEAVHQPGRWGVAFVQGGRIVGEGVVEYALGAESTGDGARRRCPGVTPVAAELVHRARPENVLIGDFEQCGDGAYTVELISPPPGHYLTRLAEPAHSLGELVEAIRQFGVLLAHETRDVALDRRFIVTSIDLRQDRPVPRGERVVIRCCGLPEGRGRGAGAMRFSVHVPDARDAVPGHDGTIGEATITGHVVSRRAYEYLRRPRGGATG